MNVIPEKSGFCKRAPKAEAGGIPRDHLYGEKMNLQVNYLPIFQIVNMGVNNSTKSIEIRSFSRFFRHEVTSLFAF
jgi:hypothetical protein